MDNGVLMWKGKAVGSDISPEDLAVTVEVGNGDIDCVQSILVDHGAPYKMTELGNVCYSPDNVWRDMPCNGGKIHLYQWSIMRSAISL